MGGMKRSKFERGEARANFLSFLADLGADYGALDIDVYGVFRCGLAHEYYVKGDCTIYMLGGAGRAGLGKDGNRYYFVVEQYYADFKRAVLALEARLFPR
jgi:hypothetical protein